jgi:hypothetical protein
MANGDATVSHVNAITGIKLVNDAVTACSISQTVLRSHFDLSALREI